MSGWQWFWTLVGFIIYIVVLVFLYFYEPFERLFSLVINGLSYQNAIFWAVGDVDADVVIDEVDALFGNLAVASVPPNTPPGMRLVRPPSRPTPSTPPLSSATLTYFCSGLQSRESGLIPPGPHSS